MHGKNYMCRYHMLQLKTLMVRISDMKSTGITGLYGTFAVVPFRTKLMSYNFFWQLLVADCDYAESCGWFLSRGNADASHAVYLLPDDS